MAPSNSDVAVIFGVGSNIGTALAKGFVNAGYRVATVSRSSPSSADTSSNPLHIQADLSDPAAAIGVFDKVRSAGLEFPSVVVWNLASLTPPADSENPLSIADSDLDRGINSKQLPGCDPNLLKENLLLSKARVSEVLRSCGF